MAIAIGLALLAYLIGSIPTGYIFFKIKERKDIRSYGSQSIGATNILRTAGLPLALIVLALDMAKGALPAILAKNFISSPSLALAVTFFAAFGHCFPFSLGFRGGKGVATSAGIMAIFSWPSLLLSACFFLIIILVTRIVSVGSLAASVIIIPLIFLFHHNLSLALVACLFTCLIWLRHQANIKRLWRGEERQLAIGQKGR